MGVALCCERRAHVGEEGGSHTLPLLVGRHHKPPDECPRCIRRAAHEVHYGHQAIVLVVEANQMRLAILLRRARDQLGELRLVGLLVQPAIELPVGAHQHEHVAKVAALELPCRELGGKRLDGEVFTSLPLRCLLVLDDLPELCLVQLAIHAVQR